MFDTKVLVVILLLAVIIFGTKRLRSIGSDLGGSIKAPSTSIEAGR
jgi:TatA/E family protein of Tat protein translocase